MEEGLGAVAWRDAPRRSACVQSVTASGSEPPVMPLARQRMSGATPACSQANSVPVRPQPVITSSAMNRAPCACGDALQLAQDAALDRSACRRRRGSAARRSARPTGSAAQAASKASSVVLLAAGRRERNALDVEQQRLVGRVEHAARADRHAADRVAVIAVLERDDAAARRRRCCASSRAPSSARPRRRSSRCRKRRRARARRARSRSARAPASRPARA